MHMAVQAQTHPGLLELADERVIDDFLIAGDRVMPDRDAQQRRAGRKEAILARAPDLELRLPEAAREGARVDARAIQEVLVDLPGRVHREELKAELRAQDREALLLGQERVRLLQERM